MGGVNMSVVVAIKKDNKVYLGCDSQVTSGGTRTTLKNPDNYKIWKVLGTENCLMASVGDVRDACVVRTMDRLVTDYNIYKGHISFDFVVNSIVPDIIQRLEEVRYLKKEGVFEGFNSSFLFAYDDQLYLIASDGSVITIEDFVAIGSGKNEAVGSLLSTDNLLPEERIVKAIKASAANDIYVDYPIIMTNTENTEFEVITEKSEKTYLKNKRDERTTTQK